MSELTTKRPGRIGQIRIFLAKQVRLFFFQSDWRLLIFSAAIAVLVAKVVGRGMFVTMEGTKLGALAITCICLWNGVFNSIQVVCRERQIIKREHRGGMHISSYMISHAVFQAMICALQTVISMIIFQIMGMHPNQHGLIFGFFNVDFFMTLFLITFAADMMGLMVSCIVTNTTSAMTAMPLLLIVQLVFAGIAFPLSGMMGKISDFTLSKWGIHAICTESNYNALPSDVLWNMIQRFNNNPMIQALLDPSNKSLIAQFTSEHSQEMAYEYTAANVLREWGILLACATGFFLIGLFFLEFIDHDKR